MVRSDFYFYMFLNVLFGCITLQPLVWTETRRCCDLWGDHSNADSNATQRGWRRDVIWLLVTWPAGGRACAVAWFVGISGVVVCRRSALIDNGLTVLASQPAGLLPWPSCISALALFPSSNQQRRIPVSARRCRAWKMEPCVAIIQGFGGRAVSSK